MRPPMIGDIRAKRFMRRLLKLAMMSFNLLSSLGLYPSIIMYFIWNDSIASGIEGMKTNV